MDPGTGCRARTGRVWSRWREQLRPDLTVVVENGELPAGFDIEQTLFGIIAIELALNVTTQIRHDREAAVRPRRERTRLDQP
ncbi:TetR family transcriptional regulator C-terminal domain-containing protein [Nocardia sp. NPDC052316]|uniref:TetR family transcriptional regulator C-terminal domain-containing protein n=1 Tax=Nocardia sp. NPDC052316 TaxID=3364329 RepID=UPI0037C9F68F